MSVWIGRNDIELGTEGPFSISRDFSADIDISVSGFSSLMLEEGKDDVEEDGLTNAGVDGTLDVEEDDEKDVREEVVEDIREYVEEDVVIESLFDEVSVRGSCFILTAGFKTGSMVILGRKVVLTLSLFSVICCSGVPLFASSC